MKPRPGIVQGAQNFKNNAEITADYRGTPDPLFSRIRALQIRQPACLRTAGLAQLKGHYVSALNRPFIDGPRKFYQNGPAEIQAYCVPAVRGHNMPGFPAYSVTSSISFS